MCASTAPLNSFPGRVAQLAEHSTLNRQVVGSIPTGSTIYFPNKINNLQNPLSEMCEICALLPSVLRFPKRNEHGSTYHDPRPPLL